MESLYFVPRAASGTDVISLSPSSHSVSWGPRGGGHTQTPYYEDSWELFTKVWAGIKETTDGTESLDWQQHGASPPLRPGQTLGGAPPQSSSWRSLFSVWRAAPACVCAAPTHRLGSSQLCKGCSWASASPPLPSGVLAGPWVPPALLTMGGGA